MADRGKSFNENGEREIPHSRDEMLYDLLKKELLCCSCIALGERKSIIKAGDGASLFSDPRLAIVESLLPLRDPGKLIGRRNSIYILFRT